MCQLLLGLSAVGDGSEVGGTVQLIALLMIAAGAASAADYSFEKNVDIPKLQRELKVGGFNPKSIQCVENKCKITWAGKETKDPAPFIEAHVAEDVAARRLRIEQLARNWKKGTITVPEKDELLKLFILQQLGL